MNRTLNHILNSLKAIKNWHRILLSLIFVFTSCFLLPTSCLFAAFDELNIGARPQGMSGAFTAVANDANALFYNPAGMTLLKKAEFTSNYGRLFMGLDDNSSIGSSFLGYVQPLGKYGTPGFSWYNLTLSNLYDETAVALSYAYPVTKYLSTGISVKNLSRKFGSDDYTRTAIDANGNTRLDIEGISGDPVFDKGKKSSAFSGDFGILYLHSSSLSFGFSAQNITKPDIGLSGEDKIPSVYRIGAAYNKLSYLLSLETVSKGSDLNVLLGGEKWFAEKNIGLRGGLSLGSRRWNNITGGLTVKFDNFSFDYALLWQLSGIKDTLGTHKIALNIKFGRLRLTKDEQNLREEKAAKVKAELEAKKALFDAEKFQKEAEKIKLEMETKLKEAAKVEEESRKLQKTNTTQDLEIEKIKKKDELEKSYKDAMLYYQKRVAQDAEVPERLLLLDKVIKKYENRSIDISDAYKEKETVIKIQMQAKSDYDSSFDYYRRLKERGATEQEKKILLLKIIEKYKGKGVNISEAEKELSTIK
ncbi:MAG: type IX secretion system membrane protein PorP/SprF [Elusimicrobia bacterium]|nr:type IX secretion system membrane protein PorP/SprF [Elusimicrobiota bacterium]